MDKASRTKITVILAFQIPAALFFILFITGLILRACGSSFYLFGQTGTIAYLISSIVFFLIEGLFVIVFGFMSQKYWLLVLNLLFIPLICFLAFGGELYYSNTYEINLEKSRQCLIIENQNFLLGGYSNVYQKTGWLSCRLVARYDGDDGEMPLASPEYYTLTEYDNGISFSYKVNGNPSFGYLKFANGNFSPVSSVEEIK